MILDEIARFMGRHIWAVALVLVPVVFVGKMAGAVVGSI